MTKKEAVEECPNCGEEISKEDAVCPHCGSLIEEPCHDAISDEDEEEG